MNQLTLTYALLGHYKESCKTSSKSIWEIYLPIVKKAINDYFIKEEITAVKGRAITELQQKIFDIFEIKFPIPVLYECLVQLQKDIDDDTKFVIYSDYSFVIKVSAFENVDVLIRETEMELAILERDFDSFCQLYKVTCDFNVLLEFINNVQIEIFVDANNNLSETTNSIIPLYINNRKDNKEIFRIISHIYIGGLLSSYLTHKIKQPVTRVELLIDTNFFISLIDLNTEDAHTTCQDLYSYCKCMGFYMTILPTTVEQIKILLSSRITDFANKDYLGTIKKADVFAACKRRGLDKTDLELIRNKVRDYLKMYDITILQPAQIKAIAHSAEKGESYKILKEKRNNKDSALNDAIAIEYVNTKRGNHCSTFADVQCWFLHNSYGSFYYDPGASVVKRTSISAPELLTMLWMSNPSQIDSLKLSRVGLTAYVTKYMEQHLPSDSTLKVIYKRAMIAQKVGEIKEEDLYSLCTRMSEGCLSQEELLNLEQCSDRDFSIFMAQQAVAYNEIRNSALDAINADRERQNRKRKFKECIDRQQELSKLINDSERKLVQLEEQRKKSFKNWKPNVTWLFVVICIIIIFSLILSKGNFNTEIALLLCNALIAVFTIIAPILAALAIHYTNNVETRKKICYEKWENDPNNSEYITLKNKIAVYAYEKKELDDVIAGLLTD